MFGKFFQDSHCGNTSNSQQSPQKTFGVTRNSHESLEYILKLKRNNLLAHGRNKKEDLQNLIRVCFGKDIKVNHSIEYDATDGSLFELGGGLKKNEHIQQGCYGTIKIARKIKEPLDEINSYETQWFIGKVPAKINHEQRNKTTDQIFQETAERETSCMQALGYNVRYLPRSNYQPGLEAPGTIIMPYFEGQDLVDYLNQNSNLLSKEDKFKCAFAVMQSVKKLHNLGYAHYDIKPENIIYMDDAKLIDFGCCLKIDPEKPSEKNGTLEYMDPRLLTKPLPNQSLEFDIYSLAITIANIFQIQTSKKLKKNFRSSILSDLLLGMIAEENRFDINTAINKLTKLAEEKSIFLHSEEESLLESKEDTPLEYNEIDVIKLFEEKPIARHFEEKIILEIKENTLIEYNKLEFLKKVANVNLQTGIASLKDKYQSTNKNSYNKNIVAQKIQTLEEVVKTINISDDCNDWQQLIKETQQKFEKMEYTNPFKKMLFCSFKPKDTIASKQLGELATYITEQHIPQYRHIIE